MILNDLILDEFQQEIANTRKMLERELATHIANLLTWTASIINSDSLDIAPPGVEPAKTIAAKSLTEVLERFEQNCNEAKETIANTSDEHLPESWTMLMGGKMIFTMPRLAVLRSFVLNHNIHHRAQLGVYLRLNEVPVPGIYGPSADEVGM
jgi:uncharacterized damage-inducible protein DinB